jgi:SAM-dependent methyltransferase
MPYSDSRLDDTVLSIIRKIKPEKVLDVGPGYGKYARLISPAIEGVRIDGVEIDKSYIKKFNLNDLYDKIYNCSIQDFISDNIDTAYDLVIFGDVIEHLKKSEGIDALNFFVYRTKHIIVQWPHGYIQNAWEGRKHEAHISTWGKSDFGSFDFKWYEKDFMRLVHIKGYLE